MVTVVALDALMAVVTVQTNCMKHTKATHET
jgi:hypothetical protein